VKIQTEEYEVEIAPDPAYSLGSIDNTHSYAKEYVFGNPGEYRGQYSIGVNTKGGTRNSCIVIDDYAFGETINDGSATIVQSKLFVAMGNSICCFTLPSLEIDWRTKVDIATCFRVYYSVGNNCLISHGEVEIVRLNLEGDIVWKASGADIFTEGFSLFSDRIEVIDYYHAKYRIDIVTGQIDMVAD
jgi:hypothetical protein